MTGSTNGKLAGSFKVGAQVFGAYTVIATGNIALDASPAAAFNVVGDIVLNPTSGSPTSTIAVVGAGFSGTASATCAGPPSITGTPAGASGTCAKNADGTFTGQFTVQAVASGTYIVTYTDNGGGNTAFKTFTVTGGPIISLSPNTGPTGTTVVTVSGSGFNSGDTSVSIAQTTPAPVLPDVLFTPQPKICSVSGGVIAAGCTFTVSSTAPGQALPGYTITATGNAVSDSSTADFFLIATLTLTPNNGGPNSAVASGTLVTLSGSGYLAVGAPCTAPIQTPAPLSAAAPVCNIDGNGVLTGSFNVNNAAVSGAHTFSISDVLQVPQTTVSASFTVTVPAITFTPNSGSGGDTIQFSASGFSTGDTSCTLTQTVGPLGNTIAATPPPSCNISGGTATGSFVVRTANNGAEVKTLLLAGSTGDGVTASFTVVPKISLSPNLQRVGGPVAVTGTNFNTPGVCAPGITGPSVNAPTCTVNADFTLTGSFSVVVTFGGLSDLITVSDGTAIATATLNIIPRVVTLTPSFGPIGAVILVSGTGFATTDLTCAIAGPAVTAASPCSISGGTVSGSFIVVAGAPSGPSPVIVTGAPGTDFGVATFTVVAKITLFPTVGRVGTNVQITGSGFAALDTGCSISSTPSGLISNPLCNVVGGAMSGSFTVAGVSSGPYTVTITGNTGDFGSATFTVPPPSTLVLSPISGPPGTGVSASGSNYQGTTCQLTSSPGGLFTSQSCTIAAGALTGGFNVAAGAVAGNSYTVTVQTNAGAGDSASANFAVTVGPGTTLTLTPTSGPVGAVVSGSGTGFTTDTTCSLISAPAGVLSSPSCTVAGGNANVGFTVPLNAPAGSYTILAVGDQGHSASATFSVTVGPTGTLTLTPTSGPINTVVSGVGTGFTGDATCQLSSAPATIMSSPSCAISGGKANIGFAVSNAALAGTYTIFVLGNAGTSASATFTVTAGANPSFTLSTNPSTMTLNPGGVGTVSVTVQSINQFNSAVTLAAPTLPTGVSAGFSSNPVTPPAGGSTTSVLTLTATNTAPATTTVITVTGTGGGVTASAGVTLIVSVAATSTSVVTSIGPWVAPKCVIATATFGSEASPAVQFLRSFRDRLVLSTTAGSAFMQVFNAWYYSFSPSVAQFIANNDPLRAPVRVFLYPLLGILGASAFTYSLFSASPEFAVVMAGLVASSLIGLVYLTPFTLVGMRALTKRRRINVTNLAKGSLLLLAAALALLAAGELAGSLLLLAVASSAIVLTCIIAAPTIVALLVLRPKSQ